MSSLQLYPTADVLNTANVGFTPRDDVMNYINPCTLPAIYEGSDLQVTFPARSDKFGMYVSPRIYFRMKVVMPYKADNPDTHIPLVWGDPWIGLYALFKNIRIMIGGQTRKTGTDIEVRAWIDYVTASMSKEDRDIFQSQIRARWSHPSTETSGSAACGAPFGREQTFYRASVDTKASTATYYADINLPVPFLSEIVPLDAETRAAYPLGVFPMGVFQEPLTVVLSFNRGQYNVPTAPTVYYDCQLAPHEYADHSSAPKLARGKWNNGMDTVMYALPSSGAIPAYMDLGNPTMSADRPSILNMDQYPLPVVIPPTATPTPGIVTWDYSIVGASAAILFLYKTGTNAATMIDYVFGDNTSFAGFYGCSSSFEAQLGAENLGAMSTVQHYGPTCDINETTLACSYTDWASGSTGYLDVRGALLPMRGRLADYLPQAVIGAAPLLGTIDGNGVSSHIDASNRFCGLLDPTLGLRNPWQISTLARLDACSTQQSYAPQTQNPRNYTESDPVYATVSSTASNTSLNGDRFVTLYNQQTDLIDVLNLFPSFSGPRPRTVSAETQFASTFGIIGFSSAPTALNRWGNYQSNFCPVSSFSLATTGRTSYFTVPNTNPLTVIPNLINTQILNSPWWNTVTGNTFTWQYSTTATTQCTDIFVDNTGASFTSSDNVTVSSTNYGYLSYYFMPGYAANGLLNDYQLPTLFNLGGDFAGRANAIQLPNPYTSMLPLLASQLPISGLQELTASCSAGVVLTSKTYYNDFYNVSARSWNYTFQHTIANATTLGIVPFNNPTTPNTQTNTCRPTVPGSTIAVSNFKEYKIASRESLRKHCPQPPGYMLDMVESFATPASSVAEMVTGALDAFRYTHFPGPMMSGYQSFSTQMKGLVSRTFTYDTPTSLNNEGTGPTGFSLDQSYPSEISSGWIGWGKTAGFFATPSNAQFNLNSYVSTYSNDPHQSDFIRSSIFTARNPTAASGDQNVSTQTITPAAYSSNRPPYQAPAGSAWIPPIMAGVQIWPANTTLSNADFLCFGDHFLQSRLTSEPFDWPTLLPTVLLYVGGAVIGAPGTKLFTVEASGTNQITLANLTRNTATARGAGAAGVGNATDFRTLDAGHGFTTSVTNLDQIFSPFPHILVGVLGGGYGPLGVNQLQSNCLSDWPVHTFNVNASNAGASRNATFNAMASSASTDAIVNPGPKGIMATLDQIRPLNTTGWFPSIAAPVMAYQMKVDLNVTLAVPAKPDLLTPGLSCEVVLQSPAAKWGYLSCEGDADIESSFTASRELYKGSGIPTMCPSFETLLYNVPLNDNPSVSFNFQGQMAHGIGIRVMKGNIYSHVWQDRVITACTVTVGGDTIMPITYDMIHQPSRPRYIPGQYLPQTMKDSYAPHLITGGGVHVRGKLGVPDAYVLDLQETLFSSIDATVPWDFDFMNNQDHYRLWIPFSANGPVVINNNVTVRLTLSDLEVNTYFPVLEHNYVPHPMDVYLDGAYEYTSSGASTNITGIALATENTGGAIKCPTTHKFGVNTAYATATNVSPGVPAVDPSSSTPWYCHFPSTISVLARSYPLPSQGTSTVDPVNAASQFDLQGFFLGYYTDSVPFAKYFPPEWLTVTNEPTYTSTGTNNETYSRWIDLNRTTFATLPTVQILPASKYQPFGVREFSIPTISVGEDTQTVEITLVRSQEGLMRESLYVTRM